MTEPRVTEPPGAALLDTALPHTALPGKQAAELTARVSGQEGGPRVWLVPTPVGNLGDITLRAVEVLRGADAVACEDTRRSGALLSHLDIHKPLVRLDAHTMRRAPAVLEQYPRLAYVSDAGTPGVSDPGAELVAAAVAAAIPVEVLPGATAFVPALVLSGLDTGRFTFEGFLPRSGRERKSRLLAIASRPETCVLYESPHRLGATLNDLAGVCGESRPASMTRELSKKFEETARGTLGELAARFAAGVRGEIVVVVAGRPAGEADLGAPPPDHEALAGAWAGQGKTARDIRDALIAQGLRKNDAYALALRVTERAGSDASGLS
ncbi:16S rRNA (cytidine(1402)-2'-O)-methyltransferase [Deinococcus frigens]|uniref:16S rRNA (cytidine(1402)-2'-O)-methyltransferase n=1 Tax=Deinococcus frigens TaxID=249403 RepID=UPI000A073026|nr:16S rRNA (cytidine(1402)-2'-O)-methyltransferase [Deinococcus frigens]